MILDFLQDLFDHGRVRVAHPDKPGGSIDQASMERLLLQYEAIRQQGFPGNPPEFSAEVSQWSARLFYRACQAAVYRDLGAEDLKTFLGEPCPESPEASKLYSADLVFQFLPDLLKLAGAASPADPLVAILREWANLWPLSSVGVSECQPHSLNGITDHPHVLAYYVDRVIARRDTSRLQEPAVRAAAAQAISLFSSRFPEISAKLREIPAS